MPAAGVHAQASSRRVALTRATAGRPPRLYLRIGRPEEWSGAIAARPDAWVLDGAVLQCVGETRRAEIRGMSERLRIFVEIAPLATGCADDDLDAAMPLAPDGVVLRGCVGLHDVDHLSAKLAVREAELDRPERSTSIVAMATDDAAGALALPSFAGLRNPRLVGLGCDLERLRAHLGCRGDAPALRAAAAAAVMAAAAGGVTAIALHPAGDAMSDPWLGFDRLRGQGFRGILLSDPAELEAAREVFGPA